jgi:FAD-dependent urate hydroxylase
MRPYPKASVVDLSERVLAEVFSDGGWGGKGRITFIGDAAHGMRFTDGYGISMAMEDAVVLARILRDNRQTSSKDIAALLKQYERERRPRVKRVYDNQQERYNIRFDKTKRLGPQDPVFLEWLFAGI